MSLYLETYDNTAENNRVDKTPYITSRSSFYVLWKEGTSIMAPIVELKYSGTALSIGNYCSINDDNNKRWYYIMDVITLYNNYFQLQLKIDVLMTYREFIINSLPCLVDRNEYISEKYLKNEALPLSEEVYCNFIAKRELYDNSNNVFCYVVKILSIDSSGISYPPNERADNTFGPPTSGNIRKLTTEATYILPVKESIAGISGSNPYLTVLTLLDLIVKNSKYNSYVLSLTAYQFDLVKIIGGSVSYSTTDNKYHVSFPSGKGQELPWVSTIPIGEDTLQYQAMRVDQKYENFLKQYYTFTELRLNYNFLDFEPYTRIQMYLPYYGSYTFNMKTILAFRSRDDVSRINIFYTFEPESGACTINICLGTGYESTQYIIETLNCQIGQPVDLSYTTMDSVNRQKLVNELNYTASIIRADSNYSVSMGQAAAGMVSSAGSIVGGAISGSPSGIINGATGVVDSMISMGLASSVRNASIDIASLNKNSADVVNVPYGVKASKNVSIYTSFYYDNSNIMLIKFSNAIILHDSKLLNHTFGQPVNTTFNNLSDMYGFTILSAFHLDGLSAFEPEKSELASLLMSGIILPNPPST